MTFPVILFLVPGMSVAHALEDWPNKEILKPVAGTPAPKPVGPDLNVSYRCGFSGGPCDLAEFMRRNSVCDILVVKGTQLQVHETLPKELVPKCDELRGKGRHGIASITKSITSLIFGWVNTDPVFGPPIKPDDLVHTVLAPSLNYPDKDVRVASILHMSTGMKYENERDVLAARVEENDLLCKSAPLQPPCRLRGIAQSFLEKAKFDVPEVWRKKLRDFNYSNFDTMLLGFMAEDRLRGVPKQGARGELKFPRLAQGVEHFFWRNLPMFAKAEWKSDYENHSPGYCCLRMAPRDLATLGGWVLDEYKNRESAMGEWIRESVRSRRQKVFTCKFGSYTRDIDYGYQWWVPSPDENYNPPGLDGFTGIGRSGQFLHIFPRQDVVVVQLSAWTHTRRWYEFWKWFNRSESNRECESLMVHRLIADKVAEMAQVKN